MFRLARLSLANRAVVALVTIAIAVFGVLSMTSLKQELIPSIQLPTGIVAAQYPGSSPAVVEEQVTDVIEEAVTSVDGVASVRSTASTGMSLTTVELDYGTDMEAATQRLQSAVAGAQQALPEGVEPQVTTGSVDDVPVVQMAVSGDKSPNALAGTVEDVVVPALEEVDGVRSVAVTGQSETEVRILPDQAKLAAAGLSTEDLTTVLQDNGVVMPAGEITDGGRAWSVQLGKPVDMVDQLKQLPVLPGGGGSGAAAGGAATTPDATTDELPTEPLAPVLLGQVASVQLEPVEATSYSRLDGSPSLGLAITKTPEANTVEVSHAIEDALAVPDVADTLDERKIATAVVFDQAPFIEDSIHGLATEGGLGLLFAVLVILVFLMSMRSTLVSAISIPLSLAVTFIAMDFGGYTLNILTLGALTISIGRVVDDAIVVIENIKRHMSYGGERAPAILAAVREVGGAIAASTICTVAVFLPIALVGGMVGELFRPFALTVSIAMLASLVVALTIVPVLAYWFIRPPRKARRGGPVDREAAEDKESRGIWQRIYVPTLNGALRLPAVTISVAVAILGGTAMLVPNMETSFLGDSGQDTVTVTQHYAPGTSLEGQDEAAQQVEAALADVGAVDSVQATVGSGGDMSMAAFGGASAGLKASFAITLDEDADGERAAADIRSAVADLTEAPATEVSVSAGDSVGTSSIDLVVRARDDETLAEATNQLQEAMSGLDASAEVTNDLAAAQEIVEVTVDRKAAAQYGLTETQVSGIASAAMTGAQDVGELQTADGPVGVALWAGPVPETMTQIGEIPVPTATGAVRLIDVAKVELASSPTSISRIDGERSATVSVTPSGADLGAATEAVNAELESIDLPAGAAVTVGGAAADQADAFNDLGLALVAAIALVFVVMVATFRSLAQPFILLVSVPFAAVGALVALVATDTPLGVPALIGTLLLVGIVVSNAIVLIDLINQYRARGMALDEAVREGARKRLRPIVMTALATVFALTPMGIGLTGGGAFISQPLALVVIGGLVSSTLLTLYVVPVIYTLFERRAERRRAADEAAGRVRRPLTGALVSVATGALRAVARPRAVPVGAAADGALPAGAMPNGVVPAGAAPGDSVPGGAVPAGAPAGGVVPNGATAQGWPQVVAQHEAPRHDVADQYGRAEQAPAWPVPASPTAPQAQHATSRSGPQQPDQQRVPREQPEPQQFVPHQRVPQEEQPQQFVQRDRVSQGQAAPQFAPQQRAPQEHYAPREPMPQPASPYASQQAAAPRQVPPQAAQPAAPYQPTSQQPRSQQSGSQQHSPQVPHQQQANHQQPSQFAPQFAPQHRAQHQAAPQPNQADRRPAHAPQPGQQSPSHQHQVQQPARQQQAYVPQQQPAPEAALPSRRREPEPEPERQQPLPVWPHPLDPLD